MDEKCHLEDADIDFYPWELLSDKTTALMKLELDAVV